MDVYIYNADLLCSDCGLDCIHEARVCGQDNTGDSDDFPQGPYGDGGGEADCPQHCGNCGTFLENPLTSDGDDYVREALEDDTGDSLVLSEWREFYDYL